MRKLCGMLLVTALCAGPAWAWDSNANIEAAMNKMVGIYKSQGIEAAIEEAKNCYEGLDLNYRTKKTAQEAEFCVAADISTLTIVGQTQYDFDKSDPFFQPLESVVKWAMVLHKARIYDLPDQFEPYMQPRIQRIKKAIPSKL